MNVLFCDVRYHTTLHECIVLWCNVSRHPSWMYCFVIKVSQFDLSVSWKIASQLPLTKHTLWHLWTQFAENYPSDPFFPQREKSQSRRGHHPSSLHVWEGKVRTVPIPSTCPWCVLTQPIAAFQVNNVRRAGQEPILRWLRIIPGWERRPGGLEGNTMHACTYRV